jgi:hypothetical protein
VYLVKDVNKEEWLINKKILEVSGKNQELRRGNSDPIPDTFQNSFKTTEYKNKTIKSYYYCQEYFVDN